MILKKLMRPVHVFYLVAYVFFFVIEPIAYAVMIRLENWNYIAGLLFSHVLIMLFFIYCVIGISSLFVLFINIKKKDEIAALFPIIISSLSIVIYVFMPHYEYSIWYKFVLYFFY